MLEAEFDMDDIEKDEDLLRQLQDLGWRDDPPSNPTPKKPKPTPKPAANNASKSTGINDSKISEDHFSQFKVEHVEAVDDSKIDFTEDDMNDPYLLAQLRDLDGDDDFGNDGHDDVNSYNEGAAEDESDLNHNNHEIGREITITKTIVSNSISTIDQPMISFDADFSSATPNIDSLTADDARTRALSCSREGNKEEALRWLKISKMKDQEAAVILAAQSKPQKPALPPKAAIDPVGTIPGRGDSSRAFLVKQVSGELGPIKSDRFTHLEQALNSAMTEALSEAKLLINSKTDLKTAAKKMNDYKRFQEELNVLASRRHLPGAEPAPFVWKRIERQNIIERLDIADDQLVLFVEGLSGLENALTGYSSRNIQITYDLGIPKEEPATGKILGKVDSKGNVSINFQRVLPVIKRNRMLQTLFSKKKATFEVSLSRGMFLSNIVLGTGSLAMADLLSKCECGGTLPLEKASASPMGRHSPAAMSAGSITAYLRLRKPATGAEIIKTVERILVLDDWPSVNNYSPTAGYTPTPTLSLPPKPTISTIPIAETKSVEDRKEKPVRSVQPLQPALRGVLSERETSDPCAVDFLCSNDVLEAEIASDTACIVKIEEKNASSRTEEEDDALFNWKFRVQMMTTKLSLLVSSVQDEKLTFEDYLAMVRERIARDKMLAKWLIDAAKLEEPPEGCKENMHAVMRRLEIMVKELKAAEDSIQEE